MKKSVLLACVAALAIAILWATRDQDLSLQSLRDHLEALNAWRAERATLFAALFFVTYVAVTALSLPFAVWMTLAAGALFGLWWGLLIVSFASTIGATLAFLAVALSAARLGARPAWRPRSKRSTRA